MPTAKLPPMVRTLGWISFWADVSSELAYPILPLFIVGTLRAPSWTLGLIEGMAGLVIALLRLWSGIRSDQMGKRAPYIRWGYGLSSLTKPLMGLATVWPTVLVFRLMDRVGKGIRTSARDALIADSVDPSMAGRAFGFHRMMDTAGAFVGVCFGGVLVWRLPDSLRLILILTAIPGIVAVAITFLVRDPDHHRTESRAQTRLSFHLNRDVWIVLGVLGLFGLANSSDTFLLLYANQKGFSAFGVVGLYALFNLMYALASQPFGKLADSLGSGKMLLLGWILFGGCYLAMPFCSGPTMILIYAVYGIATAATDGVAKAFLVQKGVSVPKGTLIGTHYFIVGIVTLLGNLLAGLVWYRVSPETMLTMGGALALASAGALLALMSLERRSVHSRTK